MTTILPPNATRLERTLDGVAAARIGALMPAPIDTLWDPARCPAALLPWLAWALSVDHWDERWTEARQRAVIAASAGLHRIKGTRASVETALAALGFSTDLTEWWQPGGSGSPNTVRIDAYGQDVFATGLALDARLLASVSQLIDTVKPVHVHYSLRLGRSFSQDRNLRTATLAQHRHRRDIAPLAEPREVPVDLMPRAILASRSIVTLTGGPATEARSMPIDLMPRTRIVARMIHRSVSAFIPRSPEIAHAA